MAGPDDISSAHFDWLVGGRSRNQKSTVALYKIIEDHGAFLAEDLSFQTMAQDLAAVAFSLWRAVFLSDLTGDFGQQIGDLNRFLRSLLAHNAVLYQTDYNSREWAFSYYLDNAQLRLGRLAAIAHLNILPAELFRQAAVSAKEDWANAQAALDLAITNFGKVIADHDPNPV